jgi:hypothetical protein
MPIALVEKRFMVVSTDYNKNNFVDMNTSLLSFVAMVESTNSLLPLILLQNPHHVFVPHSLHREHICVAIFRPQLITSTRIILYPWIQATFILNRFNRVLDKLGLWLSETVTSAYARVSRNPCIIGANRYSSEIPSQLICCWRCSCCFF